MAAKHRTTAIICLTIAPLFLAMSPLARQITATEISINPRATYLRSNQDPGALAATPVDLSTLTIVPGNVLRIERLGDFDCGAPCVDDRIAMIGVFSSGTTLLSADQPHRVPGAINAGQDYVTSRTNFGSLPTDIPEDFLITDTIIVTPVGATHLFITAHDSLYYDNTDPDADFAVRVTVLPGIPGDYNNDGAVDTADFVVWQKTNGTNTQLPNDPNPLPIDTDQYNTWRANFGQTESAGSAANALDTQVPEPNAFLLIALALLSTCGRVSPIEDSPWRRRGWKS